MSEEFRMSWNRFWAHVITYALIALAIFVATMTGVYRKGYKEGQVDALNGIQKFEKKVLDPYDMDTYTWKKQYDPRNEQ